MTAKSQESRDTRLLYMGRLLLHLNLAMLLPLGILQRLELGKPSKSWQTREQLVSTDCCFEPHAMCSGVHAYTEFCLCTCRKPGLFLERSNKPAVMNQLTFSYMRVTCTWHQCHGI